MSPLLAASIIFLLVAAPPLTQGTRGVHPGCEQELAVEEAAPVPSFTDFRPSTHGFAFVNSFRGSPLPIPLGDLEKRLKIPARFGLCGGMSFAAADYYLAGRSLRREVPAATPPEIGTPLYQYLYARQSASLGPMAIMFTRFVEWMDLPETGEDGTHARTLAELPAILQAVESGEPVILGLVLVDGRETREVSRNHQILVYATIARPTDNGCNKSEEALAPSTLRIYDPNFPDRDDAVIHWIACNDDPRWERHVPGDRRETTRIRGFFQMAYTPVKPPDAQPRACDR